MAVSVANSPLQRPLLSSFTVAGHVSPHPSHSQLACPPPPAFLVHSWPLAFPCPLIHSWPLRLPLPSSFTQVGHVHEIPDLTAPGVTTRVVTVSLKPLVVEVGSF